MEFNITNQRTSFRNFKVSANTKTRRCTLFKDFLTLGSFPKCAGDLNDGRYSRENAFRKSLMDILCKDVPNWHGHYITGFILMVDLTMTSSKTAGVKIFTKIEDIRAHVRYHGQIFAGLMNSSLSLNSFGFNLKLTVFDLETGTPRDFEINGEDLKIGMLEEEGCYGLEITGIEITDDMYNQWDLSEGNDEGASGNQDADSEDSDDDEDYYNEFNYFGEITLTLHLDHRAVSKLYWDGLGKKYDSDCFINLIIEGIDYDMVILAGGEKDKEKGIKCHKKILSAYSPVFEAMFQADMTESKDNCVEIVDMTEEGARAMLQFVYDGDMMEALEKGEIAVELLEAGHKYQMEHLEDAMMQIIWAKPVDWLSVDLVLKVLLFSRNIEGKFEKIEKTSLAILKWYAEKSGSLMKSEEFQRLFLEYPRVAMDLAESFLRFKSTKLLYL